MKLNEQKIRALQSKEARYSVKVDVGLLLLVELQALLAEEVKQKIII